MKKRLTLILTRDQIRDIQVAAAMNYMTVSEFLADQAKKDLKYIEEMDRRTITPESRTRSAT